jgi:hypothetical protein
MHNVLCIKAQCSLSDILLYCVALFVYTDISEENAAFASELKELCSNCRCDHGEEVTGLCRRIIRNDANQNHGKSEREESASVEATGLHIQKTKFQKYSFGHLIVKVTALVKI